MVSDSFVKLHEIGRVELSKEESICVTIDAYRGFRYMSIRRYLETAGFSGATRDGITLTVPMVRSLQSRLAALPDDPKQILPTQLGKFAKRPGICVVVSIGDFKGKKGLDFRQWQEGVGWTKKGIWIPLIYWLQFKSLFAKAYAALSEEKEDDF